MKRKAAIDWKAVGDFRPVLLGGKIASDHLQISPLLPDGAVLLATASWSWFPSASRNDAFWFSEDAERNHSILWLQPDNDDGDTVYQPVAYGGPCIGVPSRHSAWLLLEKYLLSAKGSTILEPPHEMSPGNGSLDEDALEKIYELVWPEEVK